MATIATENFVDQVCFSGWWNKVIMILQQSMQSVILCHSLDGEAYGMHCDLPTPKHINTQLENVISCMLLVTCYFMFN